MYGLKGKRQGERGMARVMMHDSCMQGGQVAVAGRVMARRFMGKLAFLALTDDSGSVQIYLDKAIVDEAQPEAFKCAPGLHAHVVPMPATHAAGCRHQHLACMHACMFCTYEPVWLLMHALVLLPTAWLCTWATCTVCCGRYS